MNSNTSAALWPTAVAARSVAQSIDNTQSLLISAVAEAIAGDVADGNFSTTVALSGETSVDVQYVSALLNQGGYTISNDGTDLTINW